MSRRAVAFVLTLGASLAFVSLAGAQNVSKDPAHAPKGAYQLDTNHSQLLFSVLHTGLIDYYGRFDKLSGTLNFDANEPEKSAVSIAIDTASIDTPSERLVGQLKGPDVFDTQQFPTATFKSTSIVRTGPDTGRITGDLTLRNVTKLVTLDVTFSGGQQSPMSNAYALGFKGTATIKRSDFNLTAMPWSPFVSDDVKLIVVALFNQEKN